MSMIPKRFRLLMGSLALSAALVLTQTLLAQRATVRQVMDPFQPVIDPAPEPVVGGGETLAGTTVTRPSVRDVFRPPLRSPFRP